MQANYPQTTTVGSYPTPLWLRAFSTRDSLRDAISVVLKTQELAGIDLLVDGELHRWDINHAETNGMIDYFVRPLSGIRTALTREDLETFSSKEGMAYRSKAAGIVTEAIGPGTLDLPRDYGFVRPLTDKPLKFTVTSPYMLAKVLVNKYYAEFSDLVMAIAGILAEQVAAIDSSVVQIDEANLTGHPEDAEIAAAGINEVLSKVRKQKAVHLCFGNYGGQTIQDGTYKRLIDFINSLSCDHVVLEMARRPDSDRQILSGVRPEIGIGAGVIDIKDNQVESPDLVAKRIEAIAAVCGQDRIQYVHPDCGFWMLQRSIADEKMRSLVKGRDLFLGNKAGV